MTKKELQQLGEIAELFSKTKDKPIDLSKSDDQELLDYIRIGVKDLLLDLEATQRENEALRKELRKK